MDKLIGCDTTKYKNRENICLCLLTFILTTELAGKKLIAMTQLKTFQDILCKNGKKLESMTVLEI